MGMMDDLKANVLNWLLSVDMPDGERKRVEEALELRAYALGQHKRQLKVKLGQADDNLTTNFMGLIVERAVSMLYGDGITFDLPGDGGTPQDDYLAAVWAANKQAILLHKLAQTGATFGTPFVKIIPDGITFLGKPYPRLVALSPLWMRIETDPEDYERVMRYVSEYMFRRDGKDFARREVTERIMATALNEQGQMYQTAETAYWTVSRYIKGNSGKWEEDGAPVDWNYTFPPILHWQNLPDAESCYGRPDIDDSEEPQDRYNFVASNISKIIRYHAHPKTWARGVGGTGRASWGPDEMITLSDPAGMISNLEMQTDLASSRAFAADLRASVFDLSRTVDRQGLADKASTLTNFGLRVLFKDELDKTNTKRSLYGDALSELNRRLLVLGGQGDEATADGGKVVWPEPLPVNETEQSQATTADIGAGLVSKQTASGKRGYDWDLEQERMSQEQTAGDNVGANILRAFSQGRQ